MKKAAKKLDALITKALRRFGDLADYRVVRNTKRLATPQPNNQETER